MNRTFWFIERVPAVRVALRAAILKELKFHNGYRKRIAADLGIHPNTLQRFIKILKIDTRNFGDGRSVA